MASLLVTKTNNQLEEESKARDQAEKQSQTPVISNLAAFVQKAYEDAERFRSTTNITQRLLDCQRQNAGEYDATKLAAIEATGGSKLFANITQVKTQAAEAWLGDVFTPAADKPWDVVPTPIPNLPDEVKNDIVEEVVAKFRGMEDVDPSVIGDAAQDMYDAVLRDTFEDARERAGRMSIKMEDQCVEGDFYQAFAEFVSFLTFLPAAVMKGPVIRHKKRLDWVADEEGNPQPDVVTEAVPTFEAVDPFWFYPGPNSRSVSDSYICEVVHWDPKKLSEMKGIAGYKDEAIDAVLRAYPRGYRASGSTFQEGENEHETLNERELLYHEEYGTGTLQAVEFWGSIPGSHLKEWGMKGIEDDFKYYEVCCVYIGGYVVKAVLNPDPLDRRPYFVCSWFHNPSSIWGIRSLPEQMRHCQDAMNGAQRNLINNLAISSGPQVSVDIDAMPAEMMQGIGKMFPWKVWQYHGTKAAGKVPVDFFQPDSNASELIKVSEFFFTQADELTMIPRYVYGNQDVGGAASTATGLGMLMKSASRGIKRVIKNVDMQVLRPLIERLYTWNMRYLPNDKYANMKGDCQIIPRGALAILVKEQTQLRQQEFLDRTANPIDMEIIGMEGRATVLREIAKSMDLPEDKVVPSEEELRRRVQMSMAGQTGITQGEAPQPETGTPAKLEGNKTETQQVQTQAQSNAPQPGVATAV